MKIGIYVNQSSTTGGGFYEAVGSTKNFQTGKFEYEYFSSNKDSFNFLKKAGVPVNFIRLSNIDRFILFLRRSILNFMAKVIPGNVKPVQIAKKLFPTYNRFEKKFVNSGIDLVYFSSPEPNAIYLENLNFTITVWDLAHQELPFFPELKEHFCFETRDHFYRSVLSKSYAIIVGHEFARKQLIKFYNQSRDKIFVVPFRPSVKIVEFEAQNIPIHEIARPHGLPTDYIYYPAQYSSHKNHISLIKAIRILNKIRRLNIALVCTGGDQGHLRFLKDKVEEYELQDTVKFLPYQTDIDVFKIFKNAKALVMPSFIGPGTLPTMEAMHIGVPFLVPGFKKNIDFYENSCDFFDINSEDDLANKIERIFNDESYGAALVIRAREHYKKIESASEIKELTNHLERFMSYMS